VDKADLRTFMRDEHRAASAPVAAHVERRLNRRDPLGPIHACAPSGQLPGAMGPFRDCPQRSHRVGALCRMGLQQLTGIVLQFEKAQRVTGPAVYMCYQLLLV